jgi:hypothetical protein
MPARQMVAVDVWLNTPVSPSRPGTSGQKAGLNGAVNSVLMAGGEKGQRANGWALRHAITLRSWPSHVEEANDLLILSTRYTHLFSLGVVVIPGLQLSASMKPRFRANAQRMLRDYVTKLPIQHKTTA